MIETAKIESVELACVDPASQLRFYCEVLGMTVLDDNRVGYVGRQASLSFVTAATTAPYRPSPDSLYWKIALAVPDIELACRQLADRGVNVGEPAQFRNIGYLAHFTDPEGFTIELIEHWFKGNRPATTVDHRLLGGGAHFNLLTLRTANIDSVKTVCSEWGMKLLSIQPVESHDFTLYFFAFTDDQPPSEDPRAVENREWLYQRGYTILEIQHLHQKTVVRKPINGAAGYTGVVFSGVPSGNPSPELMVSLRTVAGE